MHSSSSSPSPSPAQVVVALLLSMMFFIVAGCGNGNKSEPAQALDEFVKASNEVACEKFMDLVDYSELEAAGAPVNKEEEIQKCQRTKEQNPDALQQITDYKILDEKIDGDRAELIVEMTTETASGEGKDTIPMNLKRTEGKWRFLVGTN